MGNVYAQTKNSFLITSLKKKVANVWEIYSARLSFILIVKQVLVEMYSWGSTSCDFIYLKHKECMKCHTFPTRGSFSNTFSEKWWNGEKKSFLDYSRIKTFQTPRGLCPMQNCSLWKKDFKRTLKRKVIWFVGLLTFHWV